MAHTMLFKIKLESCMPDKHMPSSPLIPIDRSKCAELRLAREDSVYTLGLSQLLWQMAYSLAVLTFISVK